MTDVETWTVTRHRCTCHDMTWQSNARPGNSLPAWCGSDTDRIRRIMPGEPYRTVEHLAEHHHLVAIDVTDAAPPPAESCAGVIHR